MSAEWIPLSYEQRCVLASHIKGWGSYNAVPLDPFALRISGPLNAQALRNSIDRVLQRHDALRIRLMQTVTGRIELDFSEQKRCELRDLGRSKQTSDDISAEQVQELLATTDTLGGRAPFEIALMKVGDLDHLLVWRQDELTLDYLSHHLLFQEIWTSYSAYVTSAALPEQYAAYQYRDYALWQYKLADDAWLKRSSAVWNKRLEGLAAIEWPGCGDGSSEGACSIGMQSSFPFDDALTAELREFARCVHVPLMTVMLAVYVIVVSRWCRQERFALPITVAGRQLPGLADALGSFAHILLLRGELMASDTYLDVVHRLSEELRRALVHDDFGRTVLEMPSLWTSSFTWCSWLPGRLPGMSIDLGKLGLNVTSYQLRRSSPARFSLPVKIAFDLYDGGAALAGFIAYDRNVFSATAVEALLRKLRVTCESILAKPRSRVILED